jgi:CDP-paratose 2-epimerase
VRDILFVEDLVDAMLLAHAKIDEIGGQAYNIGGGPDNTVSLLELIELIGEMLEERPAFTLEPWRPADQRYYVSNTAKFRDATGWRARMPVAAGVGRLLAWLIGSGTAARRETVGSGVAS